MRPIALIQARSGSKRLPGKILTPICGKPQLQWVVERLKLSRHLGGVVIATTTQPEDDDVVELAKRIGVPYSRGSVDDVLGRFITAAKQNPSDWYVRITADCPLTCPILLDQLIDLAQLVPADHTCFEGYPDGLSEAEVIPSTALFRADRETDPNDLKSREHVTTYIKLNPKIFRLNMQTAPWLLKYPEWRLSVDTKEDLEVVRKVCEHFAPRIDFNTAEIIRFLEDHPEIIAQNSHVKTKSQYQYSLISE